MSCELALLRLPPVEGVDEHIGVHPGNGRPSPTASSRTIVVELVPVETVAFWEAVGLRPPVGLLKEILQGLRGIRPTKPSLPSPSSSKPSNILRTSSASETPSSLALAFSVRSCSSLMYNCFLISTRVEAESDSEGIGKT